MKDIKQIIIFALNQNPMLTDEFKVTLPINKKSNNFFLFIEHKKLYVKYEFTI